MGEKRLGAPSQISATQYLHTRYAKTRAALLKLLSTKLYSQHLKLATFTSFLFFYFFRGESTLKAAMAAPKVALKLNLLKSLLVTQL